jgi:hypothetical protein
VVRAGGRGLPLRGRAHGVRRAHAISCASGQRSLVLGGTTRLDGGALAILDMATRKRLPLGRGTGGVWCTDAVRQLARRAAPLRRPARGTANTIVEATRSLGFNLRRRADGMRLAYTIVVCACSLRLPLGAGAGGVVRALAVGGGGKGLALPLCCGAWLN